MESAKQSDNFYYELPINTTKIVGQNIVKLVTSFLDHEEFQTMRKWSKMEWKNESLEGTFQNLETKGVFATSITWS